VIQPSLQLYAQDAVNENFTLAIGLRSESITVESSMPDCKSVYFCRYTFPRRKGFWP
jgi:hypothetical protein